MSGLHFPGSWALILILFVILTACGDDAVQPETGPLELTLTANARDEIVDDEEGVGLLCTIEVTATVTGDAQGTLGLRDAVIRVFLGSDSPVDSLTLSTSQVYEGWQVGSLGAGEAAGSAWWTRTPGPYRGEFELRYRTPEEQPRSATAEFQCGPEISSGAPPAITSFHLSPTSGVEAGDTVTAHYRALSELGVFRTALLVSGVREDTLWIAERYETSVDGDVAVEVPLGSPAGMEADGVTPTPDRSRVVYASYEDGCTRIYDAATESFSDCRYLHCCGTLRTDRTGSRFLRELDLYDQDLQYLRTLGELDEGSRIALTPDGATALVTTEAGVQRIDTSTGFVLDRITGMEDGGHGLLVMDGGFLLHPSVSGCCTNLTILELP